MRKHSAHSIDKVVRCDIHVILRVFYRHCHGESCSRVRWHVFDRWLHKQEFLVDSVCIKESVICAKPELGQEPYKGFYLSDEVVVIFLSEFLP